MKQHENIEIQNREWGALIIHLRFFVQNTNNKNFYYSESNNIPYEERPELDKYILTQLQWLKYLIKETDVIGDATRIQGFIHDEINNTYLRLNRRSFWEADEKEMTSAYQTFYIYLRTVGEMLLDYIAPEVGKAIIDTLQEDADIVEVPNQHKWERSMKVLRNILAQTYSARYEKEIPRATKIKKATIYVNKEETEEIIKYFEDKIKEISNIEKIDTEYVKEHQLIQEGTIICEL